MIEVDVSDLRGVPEALEKLSGTVHQKVVKSAIRDFLYAVQRNARATHRYTRRTGNLERAVKVSTTKDGGSVYIDDGQAPYGKFVHNGQRSWAPDPFLYDAVEMNEDDLDRKIDAAIDQALKETRI